MSFTTHEDLRVKTMKLVSPDFYLGRTLVGVDLCSISRGCYYASQTREI